MSTEHVPVRFLSSCPPLVPLHHPHPKFRDPENQNVHSQQSQEDRRKSAYLDTLLLPFKMWAPRPSYNLRERLSNQDLRDVLIAAEKFRTNQWRITYWVMAASTAIYTHICRVRR